MGPPTEEKIEREEILIQRRVKKELNMCICVLVIVICNSILGQALGVNHSQSAFN